MLYTSIHLKDSTMYKLEPDDIQSMLRDAARVLTQPNDREIMQRLHQSMKVTTPDQWDKCLIATLLAKAGKMHEAELVAYDQEISWRKGDALCRMARVISEGIDRAQMFGLLHAAAVCAREDLESDAHNDRLDAGSVLGEVAVTYAEEKEYDLARETAESIDDATRRQRTLEKIDELQGIIPTTDDEASASAEQLR